MTLRRALAALLLVQAAHLAPAAAGAQTADPGAAPAAEPAPPAAEPAPPATAPAPPATAPAPPATAPAPTPPAPAAEPVAPAVAADATPDTTVSDALEAEGETIEIVQKAPPGSAQTVKSEDLERYEHDDVHKVLLAVPGVYVRQEDGYGLRPNIGMRGAASDRSAKVTLMEDGVLIAPAPYSAPAAYYFPLVTRMASLQVSKGPSAIVHGPATVGGALDLVTARIPAERLLQLDAAGGADAYGKLHLRAGDRWTYGGFLIEGVKLHSDGFKHLDGGGDTGFDKHDVMLKGRLNSAPGPRDQALELKLAWANESSNESYTGLTDTDFGVDPYRRYAGTERDLMKWSHLTLQLSHRISWEGRYTVTTTAYRHDFDRTWRRLDAMTGDPMSPASNLSLRDVVREPTKPRHQAAFAVLSGGADSASEGVSLVLARNQRAFVSQGAQVVGQASFTAWGLAQTVQVGTRVHQDSVDRVHTPENWDMVQGHLVPNAVPEGAPSKDERGSALAWASYLRHELQLGRARLSYGVRAELVATEFDERRAGTLVAGSYSALVPGAGVVVDVVPGLSLLAGVSKGFLPVAPGQQDNARPEESLNVETGARFAGAWFNAEAIGFYSHYSNVKGTCTDSVSCPPEHMGEEFDAGAALIYGLEAAAVVEPSWRGFTFPSQLAYTYTHTEFLTSFKSDFFGNVVAGDPMSYVPAHQLALRTGLRHDAWEASIAGRHVGSMRDVAGATDAPEVDVVPSSTVVDLAGSWDFGAWGKLYGTVDNLLDEATIVSRRPYGARPGVPRLFVLGYKNSF